jgi:YVTN family beta-propeller protein
MSTPDSDGRRRRTRAALCTAGCTVALAGCFVSAGAASARAAVAAAAAQPAYLYIANSSGNSVTEYNIAKSSIVGTFAAGNAPVAVAVTPDGKQLYVADAGSNQVMVVKTATNKVIGTIAVGELPASIAFSPNGSTAYVLNRDSQSVSVIDTATRAVTASYSLASAEGSSYGNDLAISPDGEQAFLPLEDGTVIVLDLATGAVVNTVTLGYGAWQGVVSPDGKDVYITYLPTIYSAGYVAVVSTATDKIVHRIATNGPDPGSVAISPDGKYVYTADFSDNMVDIITTATDKVTGDEGLPSNYYPVAVAADAGFLFTANYDNNTVSQFDISNSYQRQDIPLAQGAGPDAFALVPAS